MALLPVTRKIQPRPLPGVDPAQFLATIRERGNQASQYTAAMAAKRRIEAENAKARAAQEAANRYSAGVFGGDSHGHSHTTAGGHQWAGKAAPAGKHTTNPALLHSPGKNLVTIQTAGGKVTVNKAAAAAFSGFLNELAGTGYKIKSLGGYANRQNVNNPAKKSHHAYGYAIDINPATNPNLRGRLVTDMPKNISQLAAKYGLGWGGNWRSVKDAMHFEYLGY